MGLWLVAEGGKTVKRQYRTLYADWLLTAAKLGFAHPIYPLAKLTTRQASQLDCGFLCDVTLTDKEKPPEETQPESGKQLLEPMVPYLILPNRRWRKESLPDGPQTAVCGLFDVQGRFSDRKREEICWSRPIARQYHKVGWKPDIYPAR